MYSLLPNSRKNLRPAQLRIGAKGTHIAMHRALRSIVMNSSTVAAVIFLPTLFLMLLWAGAPMITRGWEMLFTFWLQALGLSGDIAHKSISFYGMVVQVSYPAITPPHPSTAALWWNLLGALMLLLFSGRIARNYTPVAYLLRAVLVIQVATSFFYFFASDTSTLNAANYLSGMVVFSLYFISIIPLLLALVYYVFNFAFWRKLLVTSLMLAYFIVALPMQYMLHAWIIGSVSMVFLPTLYLLFGALFNTLMLVSCYAWAMSWREREAS